MLGELQKLNHPDTPEGEWQHSPTLSPGSRKPAQLPPCSRPDSTAWNELYPESSLLKIPAMQALQLKT